jgi:hypothetical protein
MNRKRNAERKRFATSAMIALPMTVALLFLMTRLILPSEQDSIVTRMIQNIELHRTIPPPDPAGILVFELPPPINAKPPIEANLTAAESIKPQTPEVFPGESAKEEGSAHIIDWWAEARKLTQESDEEEFKRWLLEQGYERYVTIMQGPLPITNSVRGTLPPSQEEATGYLNSYGDLEFKISENCVMQTQVSARLDMSDFARNLPMRVTCKSAPKVKYSFDRNERERPRPK